MAISEERMICLKDYEEFALKKLPAAVMSYYNGGADDEITMRDNVAAFKRYRIYPRVLVDISQRDLTTTIVGHRISFPVCISPSAMHCLAHPDGEVATAQGAYRTGVVYTQSTMSTRSMEEISQSVSQCLRFFQMYIHTNKAVTQRMVHRIERCGFNALVLTVDVPFMGKRRADIRNNFKLPPNLKFANFENPDEIQSSSATSKSNLRDSTMGRFNDRLTWDDIDWLRTVTSLPIIVKGILTGSDAQKAASKGVNGIIVSNHGGRQLDSVPATLDVVEEVVAAVGGRCEVYMDGGIRTGTDVLKALALGARAVFIGRPVVYALAHSGGDGVAEMLNILKEEFSSAMAFSGCRNVSEITRDLIRPVEHHKYSKI